MRQQEGLIPRNISGQGHQNVATNKGTKKRMRYKLRSNEHEF